MRLHLLPARRLRHPIIRLLVFLAVGLLFLAAPATGRADPPAPRVIAVLGDSQAQGVAGALRRMALHDRSIRVVDKSVPGTSISQNQQIDWATTIEQFLATEHPDVAVMMIGGNDRLPIRTEAGGRPIAFKSDAWKSIFAERLNHILKSFADAHVPLIWLGEPIAREPAYSGDMAYLNSIYAETVDGPGATWLPLWDIVTDETGAYAAYGKGLDGETKRLRLDDGVHFTPAGYDIVAQKLRTQIDGLLSAATPTAVAAHS